jgi:hypothetical protein
MTYAGIYVDIDKMGLIDESSARTGVPDNKI